MSEQNYLSESFVLYAKPFSVNAMSSRDQRYKTTAYKQWTYQIFFQLNKPDNQEKLQKLREFFNPKKHVFKVIMVVERIEEEYLNSENLISSRNIDITNFEKILADLFFGRAFFKQEVPYGVKNLNCDDKYITSLLSKKRMGTENIIKVKIKIVPKDY